jgi:hypothetical protein
MLSNIVKAKLSEIIAGGPGTVFYNHGQHAPAGICVMTGIRPGANERCRDAMTYESLICSYDGNKWESEVKITNKAEECNRYFIIKDVSRVMASAAGRVEELRKGSKCL